MGGECGRGARKRGYEQQQEQESSRIHTCCRHVDRDPNRVGRERGRVHRMFTAFKALYRSRYVDFLFHSFCLVRCTDLYRLRWMLLTPVATTFQCYSRLDEQRESYARNWGGTRPRVDDVDEWKSSTPNYSVHTSSGHCTCAQRRWPLHHHLVTHLRCKQHCSVPSAHIPTPALMHTAHRVRDP